MIDHSCSISGQRLRVALLFESSSPVQSPAARSPLVLFKAAPVDLQVGIACKGLTSCPFL